MHKLSGKTVLITGGTSGIGLATAQLLQAEGARVAVTGRSAERIAEARRALGDDAAIFASEAGSLAAIDQLMAAVAERFGKLDVLFLNAGVARAGLLERVSEADFDAQVDVNLKGVFFTLQKALPLLNEGAAVILTTSVGNRFGTPGSSVYSATKAALRSLMHAAALELIGRGIRVNAVCPGPIDTPMFDRMGVPPAALQMRKASIEAKSPSKRFGAPEEVAKAVLFLASADSSYVVGEEIVVDGGMSILRPIGA